MSETNAAGPAELAPKPAPGLAFDRRGVLRDMAEVLHERGSDLTSHPVANGTIADTEHAGELLTAAAAEIKRLRAEVEVLRADAERWEHARSIACFTEDRDMGPGGWWTVAVHVKRRPAANTIDAAVDAARAAQGGKT